MRTVICVAIFTVLSCIAISACAEDGEASRMLDARLQQLQDSWDSSTEMRGREYFIQAGEIAGDLSEYDQASSVAAALKLLSSVLEKMPSSNAESEAYLGIVTADLGAVDKIAQFLLAEGNLPYGQSSEKILQLSRTLGRVREEFKRDYALRPVTRNVSPPTGGRGIRVSGMDPKDIEDPRDRKIYEAAIRENSLNNVLNQRQGRLRQLEETYASQIVTLIKRASMASNVSIQVIQRAIEQAHLTEEEKAGIALVGQ